MKKEYISPEFLFIGVELREVLLSSVEDYSSHGDDGGDWGDDPIFEGDDDPGNFDDNWD